MLFPTNDQTVGYISQNKAELSEHFTIWTPDWDCIKYCYNKILTYKKADTIGLPIPKSYYPEDLSNLKEIDYLLEYPLIIKPAVMHEFYKSTKKKVFIVKSKEELKKEFIKASSIIKPSDIIIQEIIPGTPRSLYSFCSFFKEKRAISYINGQRSRQIPMDFGKASTFVEIKDIPELTEMGCKFLKAIDYYGLSEVEFKRDPRNGSLKILDVNPRTWKWHGLALKCGINLPYLLYCDSTGKEIDTHEQVNMNAKWIDLYPDLYVSIKELLKGKMDPSEFLSTLCGDKIDAVFSFQDLKPFIMETLLLPYLLMKR
jgi:predicted ATP-grasp superfamily ATP-dependent carboligase